MRIYHGSKQIIEKPAFGAGNAYNDFGLGFYCTDDEALALEWAVSRKSNGFASAYALDAEGLRIVNLCSSQFTVLHWLSVLLDFREFELNTPSLRMAAEYINRNFYVDYQGSDCIIGYRADNCLFAFARDFLGGSLSYQTLRDMISHHSCRQIALKSNRALDRVACVGFKAALCRDYYPPKASRELRMLRMAAGAKGSGLYISQMMEREVKSYDPALR